MSTEVIYLALVSYINCEINFISTHFLFNDQYWTGRIVFSVMLGKCKLARGVDAVQNRQLGWGIRGLDIPLARDPAQRDLPCVCLT